MPRSGTGFKQLADHQNGSYHTENYFGKNGGGLLPAASYSLYSGGNGDLLLDGLDSLRQTGIFPLALFGYCPLTDTSVDRDDRTTSVADLPHQRNGAGPG